MDDAYDEGWFAFRMDELAASNPYLLGSKKFDDWMDGYLDCENWYNSKSFNSDF